MGLADLHTDKTSAETLRDLADVFRKWGVEVWDAPRASTRSIAGDAQVWFMLGGERRQMVCTRFYSYADNLRAIYKALDGLRLASQRGLLDQYRQFFKALPAAGGTGGETTVGDGDPYALLGVQPDAPMEVVKAAYLTLAKAVHPDNGGTGAGMERLNLATTGYALSGGHGDGLPDPHLGTGERRGHPL